MRTTAFIVLALFASCGNPKDDPPKDDPADETTGAQGPVAPEPEVDEEPPTPKAEPQPSMERGLVSPKAGK